MARVLRHEISAYFEELCIGFFEHKGVSNLNEYRSSVCNELIKNVNEGMMDFNHCKRTSSAAVKVFAEIYSKIVNGLNGVELGIWAKT